jgi:hypothetical protein
MNITPLQVEMQLYTILKTAKIKISDLNDTLLEILYTESESKNRTGKRVRHRKCSKHSLTYLIVMRGSRESNI